MKDLFYKLRIVMVLCATIGWWGLFCPDLPINSDTVHLISANGTNTSITDDAGLYLKLLQAGGNNLRFRSRLITEINAFLEAYSWEKSTQN